MQKRATEEAGGAGGEGNDERTELVATTTVAGEGSCCRSVPEEDGCTGWERNDERMELVGTAMVAGEERPCRSAASGWSRSSRDGDGGGQGEALQERIPEKGRAGAVCRLEELVQLHYWVALLPLCSLALQTCNAFHQEWWQIEDWLSLLGGTGREQAGKSSKTSLLLHRVMKITAVQDGQMRYQFGYFLLVLFTKCFRQAIARFICLPWH